MNYKFYTEEEKEFVKNNYVKLGKGVCAEILGRTNEAIKCLALKLGVKHSKHQTLEILSKRRNIHTVNEKLFTTKISAETAYLLGFIWADGHLNSKRKNTDNYHYVTQLTILKTDADQISFLFDKTGRWGKQTLINKCNKKLITKFYCSNPFLGEFLEKNDYKTKSFDSPSKILSFIPSQFHKNFLHGYLDGDGCIYAPLESNKYSITFTSTYEQDWQFLIDISNKIGCPFSIQRKFKKNKKTKKDSKYSTFLINGSRNCLVFCDFIYGEDFKFGLIRKFEKYLIIREKIKKLIKEKKKPWTNPDNKYLYILNKEIERNG